ncbi:hypothetical protein [Hymenobacter negativus]|uniref:Uncharacterized protein n=1 Tax=Hymenobacter negativus TaxID=2795026 RepID=A0ABS3QHG3_9BACT|nr:hypothetical protein [Hymenobacter negativus]MBO2010676.1 hypothetical protein [Hymenobacter negativus]
MTVSGTSVYVTGAFNSNTVSFGPSILTNVNVSTSTSAATADVFVAKLTDAGNSGNFVWTQRAGGVRDDIATALVVSGTSVYVTGYCYSLAASFGNTTLTNPYPGFTFGFLASLTDPTLTATAPGRVLTPAQLYPQSRPPHGYPAPAY